jgi:hypothetical protein
MEKLIHKSEAAARERWVVVLLIVAVGFGCSCRLAQYLAAPSFWHDEAFLSLNVIDKTAAELIRGPLDYEQAAPPGVLLALRAAVVALGASEYSLRLVPLICGLAALPLFAFLARRTLSGRMMAVWATALLALSDEIIFQSATVKQYSGDVLVAVLLLALAFAFKRPLDSVRRFLLTCVVAAACAWASHPTVFVFGGVSLALLPRLWRLRWRGRIAWTAGNALVVSSFVLL